MFSLFTTLTFIGTLILSAYLTAVFRRYAVNRQMIDIPNARSSHTTPTPRGGGIAIIACLFLLIAGAASAQFIDLYSSALACISLGLVAAIGFMDDHKPLASHWRLIIHLLSASLFVYCIPQLPSLPLPYGNLEFTGLSLGLLILTLAWLINLYNFMDGIDGIAGIEACSVLFGAATLLWLNNEPLWSLKLGLLTAPVLGFLIWNWPPAKIFMGDTCSGTLGLLLGLLALISASETSLNLWSWAILLAIFITDASWTLATRIITGQDWHQPHHSHSYQILSRKYQSHRAITLGVALINSLWLLPMAWLATQHNSLGVYICTAAYLPLALICYATQAGKADTSPQK